MTRVLLDTDILSEIIKGKNQAVAAKTTAYLAIHERLTTSAISVAEIVYGLRRVGREDRLRQFESAANLAEVLPFDDATNIPIVSGNQAHFEQIRAAGYDLVIENWRIP